MTWDADFFYVAAEMSEPHVWATLTEHDSVIFRDHDFEVFIDPNGDNHEYYEFEINALGTTWDLLLPKPYKDDGKPVNGWEIAGLKSAVRVDGTLNDPRDTDRGWTVELAFPWRVLGELARTPSPPREGDRWRVNFSRVEWPLEVKAGAYIKPPKAREDNWVWSPQHVVDMHRPETWGYVQFMNRPQPGVGFAPDPAWEAKVWLHRLYYAQRDYRKAHGRFAGELKDLGTGLTNDLMRPVPAGLTNDLMRPVPAGLTNDLMRPVPAGLEQPTLASTPGSFEATVGLRDGSQVWAIREDSRLGRIR
jgi:hypothetical protein